MVATEQRVCGHCGTTLVQRAEEGPAAYSRRRYCSIECANRARARDGHVWTGRKPSPHQRLYGAHKRSRQRGTAGECVHYWHVDSQAVDGVYGARCMRCQMVAAFPVAEW